MINGETRIMGVLGNPVGDSHSACIQNAALKHYKLNYRYFAYDIKKDHLKRMVEAIRFFRMPGVNVTLPHKETIIPYLDEVSPLARRLGAVNTVVNNDGKLIGENTDYYGFSETLRRMRSRRMKTVTLFGAGGAARAVLAVLLERKFEEIRIACRKPARGKKMVSQLNAGEVARVVPWDQREKVQADLLVNATSLGMSPRNPLPASARVVRHARGVIDLVVRPRGTRWTALARSYGVQAEEGTIMLISQGMESFHLWFGKRPPFRVMQKALYESANGEK